jgi:hypothetical protein
MFSITIIADPVTGQWSLTTGAIGPHPSPEVVANVLALAHQRHTAPVALPEGWAPTNDGVNLYTDGGAPRYTRTFTHGDEVREAPCAPDGSPIPETIAALG